MKKLLMSLTVILFVCFASMAFGQPYELDGKIDVEWMQVYETQDQERTQPCDLYMYFTHEGPSGSGKYFILATAMGDALINALWSSWVDGKQLRGTLRYGIDPFWVEIVSIEGSVWF